MKGAWIALATSLSMAAPTAVARAEPPERGEAPSGGMERNDPGEPSAPAESAPSYGSERQDSNDASSSPDVSPPSSDRDGGRYSHEAPDVGREHRGKEHDSDARPRGESGGHSHSTLPADGEATGSTPPGARLRNPDSAPPTDALHRHPRPHDRGSPPEPGLASDDGSNDGSLSASYGYSAFDYGGRSGYAPDYFRNRSRRGGSLRLLVDPGQTGVYVDGYYAGSADEFNGTPQRLFLSPGHHEITLVLDGYRTHRMHVYVSLDHVIDLQYPMEPVLPRQR
ncbi:MAG: hypothetical protein DMD43_01205 [Gemmatimonadetes bacterium]|nr:MAG: hypothetical protein DMD43_01205 [Gemmatimonadota bacterium]